jgi:hypothetical protein
LTSKTVLIWVGLFIATSPAKVWADSCAKLIDCDTTLNPNLLSTLAATRTQAIRKCLAALAVPFPSETKLYTYGHRDKIKTLRTLTQDQMWAYQTAFQSRREMRMILDLPLEDRDKILHKSNQLAEQNYDLALLLKAFRLEQSKSSPQKLSKVDAFAFQLAAYSKIYPDLLNQLKNSKSDVSQEETKDPIAKAHLAGIKMADQVSPGFDSTAGMGTYLAQDPAQALDHLGGEGEGLACQAPTGNVLINLDSSCVKEALTQAQIYVPEQKKDTGDQFIMRPQGKNLFISPKDFEAAAQGYMIAFKPSKLSLQSAPYYVDKKALHFEQNQSQCKPITLLDFEKCSDFKALLNFPSFPNFLTEQNGFIPEFRSLASKCLQQCTNSDELDLFKKITPLAQNKKIFKELKNANRLFQQCGCRIKERGDFMTLIKQDRFTLKCNDRKDDCDRIVLKTKSLDNLHQDISRLSSWIRKR